MRARGGSLFRFLSGKSRGEVALATQARLLSLFDSVAKRVKTRGCVQRSLDEVIEERIKISLSIGKSVSEDKRRREEQST